MCHGVYYLQPLLTGSLPAIVSPEPEGWLALDGFLQGSEIHLGNLEFLAFLWLVCQKLEFTLVVASLYPLHIEVIYGEVGFYGYLLRSCQYWGVVVQKVCPVMDVVPEWHLVGDETDNYLFAFLAHLYDFSQGFCHRDADGTQAVAEIQEEFVEGGILQHMVNLSEGDVIASPERQGGYPFPVAVMSQIYSARLAFLA